MYTLRLGATLAALLTLTLAVHVRADEDKSAGAILGKWQNEDSEATFEVYKEGATYHGKIVALKDENYDADDPEAGKKKHDRHNPDKSLNARPIIGIVFLHDFNYDGDGKYSGGTIYDPESGKTYKCKMTLQGDTLNVRGYIGTPLLGRTEVWTRLKDPAAAK